MPRHLMDLSIYLENDVLSDPPAFAPRIEYFNHRNSFSQIAPFFPGLRQSDLPDSSVWAVENVQRNTHNGTHLDAPYHFRPTMNHGEHAITIVEVDLDWCFQRCERHGARSGGPVPSVDRRRRQQRRQWRLAATKDAHGCGHRTRRAIRGQPASTLPSIPTHRFPSTDVPRCSGRRGLHGRRTG